MKTLTIAMLLAAASVAHADPSITARAEPPADSSGNYVQVGGLAGGNHGLLVLGGAVDAGTRLGDSPWSAHGSAVVATADELFGIGSGSYTRATAGLEGRGCDTRGRLCAYAGVDVGLQRAYWSGKEGDLFEDVSNDMTVTHDTTEAVAVARAGLDLGGKHLRWRPGLQLAMDAGGADGLDFTQSLAYQW